MNIAFVLRSLANSGGIERTLTDKANYLAEQGHQVLFVTYEQGQHELVFELSTSVIYVDLNCRKFTLYRYPLYKRLYKSWRMNRVMRSRWNTLVDDLHPDLVVITTYSNDFLSELMSVCKKIPVVVESHTAFTHDMQSHNFLEKLKNKYMLNILKKCSLLIALTEGDKLCWEKYLKNVRKVNNPVTRYVEDVEHVKRRKGRIICVGRLHEQKRYDRLISAFSLISDRHPSWYIDIYGYGSLRDSLEHQIDVLGLKGRIVIHEPTKDIYQEYLKSELFVLSSDYEGLPLVLLEAMACGTPSIATDCPFGPAEVINNYETGVLCKMDEKDLANKIDWMITHEKERHEIGTKGHKAAARYKKEIIMKEWECAYLSVLQ